VASTLYFDHRITSQRLLNLPLQKNITYSSDSLSEVAGSPPLQSMGNLCLTVGSEIDLSRILQLSTFNYHSIQVPCHLRMACGQWRPRLDTDMVQHRKESTKTKININIEKNIYNYLPCFSEYPSRRSAELLYF
jgi:hypothetical protein